MEIEGRIGLISVITCLSSFTDLKLKELESLTLES